MGGGGELREGETVPVEYVREYAQNRGFIDQTYFANAGVVSECLLYLIRDR